MGTIDNGTVSTSTSTSTYCIVYISSISAKYSSQGYKADKNVLFTWQEFLVKKLINYSLILAAPFNFTSNCVNSCEV